MHEFKYKKNQLYCENVKIEACVEMYKTPLYVYSHKTITSHYRKLREAFRSVNPLICYSVKANSNLSILKTLVDQGAGLDIVSGGELFRALRVGCPTKKIVYASVGKTECEIEEAIRNNILFFNVESLGELETINSIAKRLSKRVDVAIRINPDVEPKTHKFITTGKLTNKFGIDFENALRIFSRKSNFTHIRIAGLHLHIGSQITESEPYIAAIKKMIKFIDKLKTLDIRLEYLNIGGGMGIVYDKETPQTAAKFAGRIAPLLKSTGLKIIMEPGRFIVGNAGMLVTKVLYVKSTPIKKFVIVDAGMNDLIRPALYDAYHSIAPVEIRKIQAKEKVDVVGPICESGDFLAKERILPRLAPGEYLAIFGTGAYGLSMSSNYNSRRRPAEIMVKGNKTFVIRARESYNDLIRNETVVTT